MLRSRLPKDPNAPVSDLERLGRRIMRVVAPLVGVGAIAWIVYVEHLSSPPGTADPEDATQVALGERVYARHCAECHGAGLEGGTAGASLGVGSAAVTKSDAALLAVVKQGAGAAGADGRPAMPAFNRGLTDAQMLNALAYVKSLWRRAAD
ncbi:MAG: c-type cytochrome [Alphaproteobacteria bacterium]